MADTDIQQVKEAMIRVEGKIDTLTVKVDGKFDTVDERIAHTGSEQRQLWQGSVERADRFDIALRDEARAREDATKAAQKERDALVARVDTLERWQSNMLGRLAVWGVLAGMFVAVATAVLVHYFASS